MMSRLTDKGWKNPENLMWIKLGSIHMRDEGYRTFLSKALRKLAYYENLEDESRLIEQRYATIDEYYCTACNQDYTSVVEGEGGALWIGDIPNYCPWCGAKFVSEEELAELERGGME